mmetsp:Transcript_59387/g.156361  ORF Transcript_59387/g.156361 Transcript_59387/m.156361 type:complete len:401 (+) Transcript_59387:450-1652(+)
MDWTNHPLPLRAKDLWKPPQSSGGWGAGSPWARESDGAGAPLAKGKQSRKKKRGQLAQPFDDTEEANKRARRAGRFEASGESLSQRVDRWGEPSKHAMAMHDSGGDGGDFELDYTVAGTCQTVAKKYLRLTSAPDPTAVRPEPVLKEAIKMIQDRYDSFGDDRGQDQYIFLWEQMKSIRQDLTVQRIRNDFTVEVYEMHARICLEFDDETELKQCQSQLSQLYEEGLGSFDGQCEFTAYNLLYNVGQLASNVVADIMLALSEDDRTNKFISHALQVRAAQALGNYSAFFRLYEDAPGHSQFVMDTFADRERLSAVRKLIKVYQPSLPLSFAAQQLGFDDEADASFFLTDHGVVLEGAGADAKIDCKASRSQLVEHSISQRLEEELKKQQRKAEIVPISFS